MALRGQGPGCLGSPLQRLQWLEERHRSLSAGSQRAFLQLQAELATRLRPYLLRRKAILRAIPAFWHKAITHHPELRSVINEQDEDVLSYVIGLEVKELSCGQGQCRIRFCFRQNPYFRNDEICKDYCRSVRGYRAARSSTIQWFCDCDGDPPGYSPGSCPPSFLDWLTNHAVPGTNSIAKIICEDLWLNPLLYYPREDVSFTGTVPEVGSVQEVEQDEEEEEEEEEEDN